MLIDQSTHVVESEAQSLLGLLFAAQQFAHINIATIQGHDNPSFDDQLSVSQILTITLTKERGEALGFSISEYPSTTGVFVATVVGESPAFENGLRTNDQILLVNEEDLSQVNRYTAIAILRSLPAGAVQIKVLRSTHVNLRKTLHQHIHALHNLDGKYLPGISRMQSADESINDSTISADDVNIPEKFDRPPSSSANGKIINSPSAAIITTGIHQIQETTKERESGTHVDKNTAAKTEASQEKPLSLAQQWVNQRARFNSLVMQNDLFVRPRSRSVFGQPIFNGVFALEIILGSVIIILESISKHAKED